MCLPPIVSDARDARVDGREARACDARTDARAREASTYDNSGSNRLRVDPNSRSRSIHNSRRQSRNRFHKAGIAPYR